jgi:hypothetical protein
VQYYKDNGRFTFDKITENPLASEADFDLISENDINNGLIFKENPSPDTYSIKNLTLLTEFIEEVDEASDKT